LSELGTLYTSSIHRLNLSLLILLKRHLWPSLVFLLALSIVMWCLMPLKGKYLGHDYYHYVTRILIGSIFFWQNGLKIPHYTPSLCGGTPFFADPQSMYFSLPQWLSFLIEPLYATYLSIIIFYIIGYLGFYKLLRTKPGCGIYLSHFGALLFILNGFSFSHLLVGHITHHSYLLFPWILYFLVKGELKKNFFDISVFSLLWIYTFYSGGMHIIVVFSIGLFLFLPLLLSIKIKEGVSFLSFSFWSFIFVFFSCSGKLIASYFFSKNFASQPIDSSNLNPFFLFWQYFWFDLENTPLSIKFGRFSFGPWEYIGFISKIIFLALPFLVFWVLKKKKWALFTSYLILFFIVVVLASGGRINSHLPFFKSYHNPIKILSSFIPFFIWGFIFFLNYIKELKLIKTSWVKTFILVISSLTLIFEFLSYSKFFVRNPLVWGYVYPNGLFQKLKKMGKLPPVRSINAKYMVDDAGILHGSTSLKCYEPMFGYRRDALKADLSVGPVSMIKNNYFNITHPGCLIYPKHFNCSPWDNIKVDDKKNFELFISGEAPEWDVPFWQNTLFAINFGTIAFLILNSLWLLIVKVRIKVPVPLEAET